MWIEEVLEKPKNIPWNTGLKYSQTDAARKNIIAGSNQRAQKYKGKTIAEWAEKLGCHYGTVRDHLRKYGHLDNYAPMKPMKTYQGKLYMQWAKELGADYSTVHLHMRKYGHLDKLVAYIQQRNEKSG